MYSTKSGQKMASASVIHLLIHTYTFVYTHAYIYAYVHVKYKLRKRVYTCTYVYTPIHENDKYLAQNHTFCYFTGQFSPNIPTRGPGALHKMKCTLEFFYAQLKLWKEEGY